MKPYPKLTADAARQSSGASGAILRFRPAAAVVAAAVALSLSIGVRCGLAAEGAAAPAPRPFAVIVNGDDSFTHNFNVALALEALARLQYPAANTYVLADKVEGAEPGSALHRMPPTERGLEATVSALRTRMHAGDLLLVYLTGHGFRLFGHANLALSHGSVTAESFTRTIAALPFGKLILIADQCDSGAFVLAAGKLGRDVVAVSSADDHHEVRCEPFIRPFWQAAMAPAADAASGGVASVEAAFKAGAASLAKSLGSVERVEPQYLATGSCKDRLNRLSVEPARAAVLAPAGPPATAP